ncbi:hypothetical protein STAQ_31890 [Allostella sp. ATCC 35155]|nr:hypothetical protein STAQ_31890 [Stella sp. ATCC 35155]
MKAAALVLLWPAAAAAADCGATLGEADVRRIERPRYTLAFRPEPAEFELGEVFRLRIVLCGRAGAPAPDLVRLDAWMPEHGHGMNYAPLLSREADGSWRADGMVFHMAGRWEITFDVGTPSRTERLVAEEAVE